MFYVIFSHVHLSNISFFNEFLTQNYELQFSFNVIITCNNIQYIVNYKQQFSFSFLSQYMLCHYYYDQSSFHLILFVNIIMYICTF